MKDKNNVALKSYITGFFLSVILTLLAYLAVLNHIFASSDLFFIVAGLAVIQLLVQLIFFLHVSADRKKKFNLLILIMAFIVIIILVGGSLWIMQNLNYRMMINPSKMNSYMHNQQGF